MSLGFGTTVFSSILFTLFMYIHIYY